jgi:hypothetical protein
MIGNRSREERKRFFFEKKSQKTFLTLLPHRLVPPDRPDEAVFVCERMKSFLLLFSSEKRRRFLPDSRP